MNSEIIIKHLRNIPDFPKKGIQFKDINYLFTNNEVIQELSEELYKRYKDCGITKIIGIESRGIILASILAYKLNAGLVLCRKPGKMPGEVRKENYKKEYGIDSIEIQEGTINKDDVVLIHDDLLATGGSMLAAYKLVKSFNPQKIFINFIFELISEGLKGRDSLPAEIDIQTLIKL